MTITLQDRVSARDPSAGHAFPDIVGEPRLLAPATVADELLSELRGASRASAASFYPARDGGDGSQHRSGPSHPRDATTPQTARIS
jgi:hypothetical protein